MLFWRTISTLAEPDTNDKTRYGRKADGSENRNIEWLPLLTEAKQCDRLC